MEANAESKPTRTKPPTADFKGMLAKKKNDGKATANTPTAPKQEQEPANVDPIVPKMEEKHVEESNPSILDVPFQQQHKPEEAPVDVDLKKSAIQQSVDEVSTQTYKDFVEATHDPKPVAKVHPAVYERSSVNFNTEAQAYEPSDCHQQEKESPSVKPMILLCNPKPEPASKVGQLVAQFANFNQIDGTFVKYYTNNHIIAELPGPCLHQWSLLDVGPPVKPYPFMEQKDAAVLKNIHSLLKSLYPPAISPIHKDEHPKFQEHAQPSHVQPTQQRQHSMGHTWANDRNNVGGGYYNRRPHFPPNPKPFPPNPPSHFNAGATNGISQTAPHYLGQQPVYPPGFSMQQPEVSAFNQPGYVNSSVYQTVPHQGQGVYHQAGGQQMNGAFH